MTGRFVLPLVFVLAAVHSLPAPPIRSVYEVNQMFLAKKPEADRPKLFGGDILLTPEQEERIKFQEQMQQQPLTRWRAIAKESMAQRWPQNTVVYKITSAFNDREKQTIRKALSDLAAQTCFKFVEYENSGGANDYVNIEKRGGCFSAVGRVGGSQPMSLDEGCIYDFTVQHEFMHALGIGHEHQRPDRDSYLRVFMNNVESGKEHNFNKYSFNDVDTANIRYDYESVMHYPDYAFGKNGAKTMKPKNGDFPIKFNTKVTQTDLQKLAVLGGCPNKAPRGGGGGGASQQNRKQKRGKHPQKTQKGRGGPAKKKIGGGRKTPGKTMKKRGGTSSRGRRNNRG
ncbi:Metalloendopeptidase [Aphelenchoides fujianensis]|nr:Metalloendopeptidase [Aphelenchoides fujianensis]